MSRYGAAWDRRSRGAIACWVARHGWVCPGWFCDPHPATDLTLDHVNPRARGGSNAGELEVLCRSCNAMKGDSHPLLARRGYQSPRARQGGQVGVARLAPAGRNLPVHRPGDESGSRAGAESAIATRDPR